MKKIFSSENRLFVFHVKNLLEVEGLDVQLKNEFAGGGVGDLAPLDTWLELWVDDSQSAVAEQSIERILSGQQDNVAEIECPNCHELNDNHFKICWNCGHEL